MQNEAVWCCCAEQCTAQPACLSLFLFLYISLSLFREVSRLIGDRVREQGYGRLLPNLLKQSYVYTHVQYIYLYTRYSFFNVCSDAPQQSTRSLFLSSLSALSSVFYLFPSQTLVCAAVHQIRD